MYQVYNKTSTEYAQNAPIVFNTTKFTDCRVTNTSGTTFSIRAPGRYLVSFNGVGSSTQATSPFTVALYQNEVALPETTTTVYSTAANDVGALTFSTIVNVLPSCVSVNNQANLQVVATSANSGTMTNANLVIYRLK
jgi:hypothetical protein